MRRTLFALALTALAAELPNAASAQTDVDSPEYAPAKAMRHKSAQTEMLLIDGA